MKQNSVLRTFAKYASLNVLGMIGLSCYILADTFFVARGLGADGLAALNLAIPIYSFIHGLGLMIGMGGATRFSILHSQKNTVGGNKIFTQSVQFALSISAVFVLVGLLLAGPLTSLLGANESIHSMTCIYLRVILLFAPMFMLNNVMLCFVRNDGNPNLAMMAMLGGSLSNIILDYVFIFPFGMGMFGAVLATGLAPIISLLMLLHHFIKRKNAFHLIKVKLTSHASKDISALGLSSLITEISSGIVMIVFNSIILRLNGNIGVAAYGVIANLSLVVVAIFTGIAQGIQPIISRNYGSGNNDNVKKTYRYALVTSTTCSAIIYTVFALFAAPIIGVFNRDNSAELLSIASSGIYLYFTAFFFVGINVITAVYFSSAAKPKPSFLISILRGCVIIIPMAFLLSASFDMTGVWLAFPVTEALTTGIIIWLKRRSTATK